MGDLIYLFNNKILGVVEQNPIQKTDSDIIIPNPLTNQALIKFNLPSSGITTLNMLNESGIKIKSLFNSYLDAGNNEVSVNITNIPSGNYFVSIQCTNYSKTLKLSIIK
jgi:translation initiation factor 2 alpha subunit (eIF-2alpha)